MLALPIGRKSNKNRRPRQKDFFMRIPTFASPTSKIAYGASAILLLLIALTGGEWAYRRMRGLI